MSARKLLRALLYLGPLLLWMGVVIAASTQLGRYEKSLALIQGVAEFLSPDAVPSGDIWQQYQINNAARKLAHVGAFGIFTLLAVRALQWGEPKLKWQSISGSLALCVVFAVSEAFVRFRAPDRHVRLEQFVLNAIGALLVFGLTLLYFRLKYWEELLWEGKPIPKDETAESGPQTYDS
ncbi:MAG: VanZ family protein [Armatimonadota bacterium]